MKINDVLLEFAPANNPSGGNYLKALASAWYNGTFNTGDLHKGIKSQEDVERILERGIHCGDGKIRKYSIGYNSNFDGVEIQSDDHYEYSDNDDAGNDIDSRTGQPWGPYDVVAFGGNELDESVAEGEVVAFPKKHKGDLNSVNDCPKCGGDLQGGKYMGHEVKVCMPCKQVYLPPNSGIDQKGNPIKEQGVAEGTDERKRNAMWAQITSYEKRAKETKNDIKKDHLMKMASELRAKLPTTDEQKLAETLNEFSFDGNDDDTPKDDPYKYPKPEQYRRSIDFFGKFEANHFDKEDMDDATGVFKGYWYYGNKLKQIAYFKFDNPQSTGSNDPGMGWYYEPQDDDVAEATGDEKFDKIMRKATGNITPADAAGYWPTREYEPIDLDPSYLPSMAKYKAKLYPLAYNWWSDGGDGTEEAQLRKLGWEPSYGDDYVMVVLSGIGHDGHIQYDIHDFDVNDEDLDEGKPGKPKQPEADYGDDYQDMVARVKKLAGLGPLKTVYDPAKRVYKNVPTAVQPKK